MIGHFRIDTQDDLLRLIGMCSANPDARHRLPCYQGLFNGRIGYWEPQRGKSQGDCKKFLAMVRRPALVVIGDDDEFGCGPSGWPTSRRLMAWSTLLVVHATGAQTIDYEAFVIAAELLGRVVVVECGTATLDAWLAAGERWAPRAAKQAIIAPPGQVQPNPAMRERAH